MTTRITKLSIASPLTHFYSTIINPEWSSLLDERLHKSQENREKNKPNQEDQYLKPTMRYQIEGHNISSAYNRIKYIRDNIHKYNKSR